MTPTKLPSYPFSSCGLANPTPQMLQMPWDHFLNYRFLLTYSGFDLSGKRTDIGECLSNGLGL